MNYSFRIGQELTGSVLHSSRRAQPYSSGTAVSMLRVAVTRRAQTSHGREEAADARASFTNGRQRRLLLLLTHTAAPLQRSAVHPAFNSPITPSRSVRHSARSPSAVPGSSRPTARSLSR
eukprot:CAMPEP_0185839824 /NCGR_PEP_ID=MMETSP1353-20130828/15259_1 /TAXON_ID=1077150 /ORGANISM="Erythrolobus australicus, Strain CCMP3124" /LENGTH=119 /DNA_ID=CAMNT_0028539047 /DNA_START=170 /DNA_END=525 /DNA_ORIENTATION=-